MQRHWPSTMNNRAVLVEEGGLVAKGAVDGCTRAEE